MPEYRTSPLADESFVSSLSSRLGRPTPVVWSVSVAHYRLLGHLRTFSGRSWSQSSTYELSRTLVTKYLCTAFGFWFVYVKFLSISSLLATGPYIQGLMTTLYGLPAASRQALPLQYRSRYQRRRCTAYPPLYLRYIANLRHADDFGV